MLYVGSSRDHLATPFFLTPLLLLPPFLQSTSSALSYLERRQEWVLSHISQLQERVKDLANELGVGPDDVGILQQVYTHSLYIMVGEFH